MNGLDFFSEVGNIHPDDADIHVRFITPDIAEKLIGRNSFPFVHHKVRKELRFLARQADGTGAGKFLLRHIQLNIAFFQFSRREFTHAPCHGTDAGEQFPHGERFSEVVVRACVKAHDAVFYLRFGGQHDDRRHITAVTDAFQRFNTVYFRHHDIENHTTVGVLPRLFRSGEPVIDGVHLVAEMFQHRRKGI